MKQPIVLLASLLLTFVIPCYAAAPTSSADEIESLRKENAELRARVQALEARLAQIERQRDAAQPASPASAQTPSPISAVGADPVPNPPPKLDLNDFLIQMDGFAVRYQKAETTVLKEDVLKAMQEKAESLVKDKVLPEVTAKIKDVKVAQDGRATLSLTDVRMAALEKADYLRRGQSPFSLSTLPTTASLTVRMSADDARTVKPGQLVHITGTPTYVAGDWGGAPPGKLMVLHFAIKNMPPWYGGSIVMKAYECKIATATYSSP